MTPRRFHQLDNERPAPGLGQPGRQVRFVVEGQQHRRKGLHRASPGALAKSRGICSASPMT